MADTGATSPGTMADDDAVGTLAWTDPDNAKASDDAYAKAGVAVGAQVTHYLKATNFSFSIPGGSTIDGIVVEIERYATQVSGSHDEEVKLVVGDSVVGDDKSDGDPWPSDLDTYYTYGAVDDKWGLTPSVAEINASDFGVVLSAHVTTFFSGAWVDHIRITVYYSEGAPSAEGTSINIGDAWKAIAALKINIGDAWKAIASAKINIGDVWKVLDIA